MSRPEDPTWSRISAHRFEDLSAALDFRRRLMRDKGWTAAFADGAIEEYRRFCFLCVTEHGAMTPSEEVDEVWHLHLTYSRDYWDVWCEVVLGRKLHHGPTRGGPDEDSRYVRQYAETLAAYERRFGSPPEPYWPSVRQRFRAQPRFRTVDTDRVFILPMVKLAWGARR